MEAGWRRPRPSTCQHATLTSFAKRRRKLGERLTATAHERWREGRSGITDVTVTNAEGETVAEFRGNSRTIRGTLIPETDAD